MRSLLHQPTESAVRRRTAETLMALHLAVFPKQVEFMRNVDFPTTFYFEKSTPFHI